MNEAKVLLSIGFILLLGLLQIAFNAKKSRRVRQELICKGWFLPPNTYDCGSFVVNGTAVVGKEPKKAL